MTFVSILAAPVLCNRPKAEVSEELRAASRWPDNALPSSYLWGFKGLHDF
jgi:hypothetical protein